MINMPTGWHGSLARSANRAAATSAIFHQIGLLAYIGVAAVSTGVSRGSMGLPVSRSVEVLVSQLRMPGMQMIPGMLEPSLFGIEPSHGLQKPEDYCARVLARICEPVLQQYSKGGALLVNYRQLPEALWTTIHAALWRGMQR